MKKEDYKFFIIIFVFGILFIIFSLKYNIGIPCIFHELTGLFCPGCGITRAIISLIKVEPYQAFRYNMLAITLLPFFIGYIGYKYIFKGKKKIPNRVWILLLIVAILFGIIRNIPGFSFLAPIEI